MKTHLLTEKNLPVAIDFLQQSEPIAVPTETVYGLAAPVFDEVAINRIFSIKQRPKNNPLIVHISDLSQIDAIALSPPALFYELAEKAWPGPLTMIVDKHPNVPDIVSAGLTSIGVRMPNHPLTLALIRELGQPLVAPSANPSGYVSPTSAEHVYHDLKGKVAAILEGGRCQVGIESTVVNILTNPPLIYRPGHVTQAQLEAWTQRSFRLATTNNSLDVEVPLLSPGLALKHYTPRAHVKLFHTWTNLLKYADQHGHIPHVILATQQSTDASIKVNLLSEQTLFAEFRLADERQLQEIWVLLPNNDDTHTGLIDRLQRAVA